MSERALERHKIRTLSALDDIERALSEYLVCTDNTGSIPNQASRIRRERDSAGESAFHQPADVDRNFTAAEHALKVSLKEIAKERFFSVAPHVVIQPLEKIEGGLCEIEERIIRELGIGAGASKVMVWVGPELNDCQVKEKLREGKPG